MDARLGALALAVLSLTLATSGAAAQPCTGKVYSGTFELIQDAVFARHGCTDQLCHGAASTGGLDLRPDVAYDNLLDIPATTVEGIRRVALGQRQRSLLFLNLAAKTNPTVWQAPLRAMPLDPIPAISSSELELVQRWIEGGAPRTGTVPGTEGLVDACLPPPEPINVKPLAPPDNGLQFRIPETNVKARSEHEVCFAQYYDVSDHVPAEYRSADGKSFRYHHSESRQTPMSHHLVMSVYRGEEPPNSPVWGDFVCWGGERDQQLCDRFDANSCGAGVPCATLPVKSLACNGFGPADAGFGLNGMGDGGAGSTASEITFAPGVYDEIPVRGMILWNSHAFNLTAQDAPLDAWLNYDFAPPPQQVAPVHRITNTEQIFKMNPPAFGTDEVCHVQVMPPDSHLFMISSHTHRHGKRFRIFRGGFRCQGGPKDGEPCSPLGPDFISPDICGGARCVAMSRPHVSDCDSNGEVSIDEVLRAVNIALGSAPMVTCPEADSNEDREVAVDDVIASINAALGSVPALSERDPAQSLQYVNLVYSDPLITYFDPPMVFYGPQSSDADRTITFCALYDNGYTKPSEVKTRATSPKPLSAAIPGGPCKTPTGCTQGRIGEACRGANERLRNSSCDTSAGAGDGFCDACPALGGVTSEDEMLVLLGEYYVP